MTQSRREQIAQRTAELLAARAEQKAARAQRAGERKLVRDRVAQKARRDKAKAEGHPIRGGKNTPGASAVWMRNLRARRKAEKASALVAAQIAHKAELAARRKERGLARIKTNAEMVKASREKKAREREERLASAWYSSAVTFDEAEALIAKQFPDVPEVKRYTSQAHLMACADREKLNVNRFLIGVPEQDGLQAAVSARAIFSETFEAMQKAAGKPPDLIECLRVAEQVTQLDGDINAQRKACDFARALWGAGEAILAALKAQA